MARIVAVCLGLFGLANAAAGFFRPALDANIWWIDLRGIPDAVARGTMLAACAVLVAHALYPRQTAGLRWWVFGIAVGLAGICALNAGNYFALMGRGLITSRIPVPLSLATAMVLAWIAAELWRDRFGSREINWRGAISAVALC